MGDLLQDFPPSPLDAYRAKSSFDWKKLKVFLNTEDGVRFEKELSEELRTHPEFQPELLSLDFVEERRVTARQSYALGNLSNLYIGRFLENSKLVPVALRLTTEFKPAASVKDGVSRQLFASTVRGLGTKRHNKYLEMLQDNIKGCFCLTEIGHGSNAQGMRCRASYDKNTQEFVLHTPDFEAAKCWAGALGQLASFAAVYAQLYIDDVHHGLHTFVVPIRDPNTFLPYPGVIVGDMGEKIGLNGIDNGFLMFENYRIPRENLLNKNGDVTPEGKYVARVKDSKKRYGAALGGLSVGRVNITGSCETYAGKALTIAIRYAAIRKQFGPTKEEISILEYQSHQHRLLPYLAAVYVVRMFSNFFMETTFKHTLDMTLGEENPDLLADRGMEIHVVSSASKPVAAWMFRDAIQECREACGGHGYLKSAGIGTIRGDHDATLTYEGECHILIQQTSNYLIKLWPLIEAKKQIKSPLQSMDFLSNTAGILQGTFTASTFEEVISPGTLIGAFEWLVCYLLKETVAKQNSLASQGAFEAKNNTQVFFAKTLATVFVQRFFLVRALVKINEAQDPAIKAVLLKLLSLYGLWALEKHLGSLYEGGYFVNGASTRLVKEAILRLCAEVKDEAVSLIDAIAPPDFMLESVLGQSDGRVYDHLKSAMFRSPHGMSRPKWWREIADLHKTSKL